MLAAMRNVKCPYLEHVGVVAAGTDPAGLAAFKLCTVQVPSGSACDCVIILYIHYREEFASFLSWVEAGISQLTMASNRYARLGV